MKRVLIVDDDVDIRESLALLLEDRYEIVTAADGREALAVLGAGGADVVLLDLMMPVMSGEDVVRELRRRGSALPIALVSASRDLSEIAQTLGVGDFIVKPFDLAALERVVARLTDAPAPGAQRLQVGSPPQSSSPQSIF